jgi:transposase
MLHAGLDLSRRGLDVCLLDDAGKLVAQTAAAPDADGLRHLVMRVEAGRVRAVIESMNGARFVHDRLEELGWDVLIADAQKVKGLAPLACKTDRIDATSSASRRRPSWSATAVCVRASSSPAQATVAARSQSTARAICAGACSKLP